MKDRAASLDAPATADELRRFADLQDRFKASFRALFDDRRAPRTVLIVATDADKNYASADPAFTYTVRTGAIGGTTYYPILAADLAGISYEELYTLNPAFHRWATDPAGRHWRRSSGGSPSRTRCGREWRRRKPSIGRGCSPACRPT